MADQYFSVEWLYGAAVGILQNLCHCHCYVTVLQQVPWKQRLRRQILLSFRAVPQGRQDAGQLQLAWVCLLPAQGSWGTSCPQAWSHCETRGLFAQSSPVCEQEVKGPLASGHTAPVSAGAAPWGRVHWEPHPPIPSATSILATHPQAALPAS